MHRRVSHLSLVLALMVILLTVLLLHYINLGPNVSSVEAVGGIGVYWDENCTRPVSSIAWGNLSLGQQENVTVYVRNGGNETLFLTELASDWNPVQASQYLNFSWDIHERELEPGSTISVAQTLQVFTNTTGISTFGFSITFYGEKIGDLGGYPPGSDVPQFFYFDGSCGSDDAPLFVRCLRGTAPADAMYLGDLGCATASPPYYQFFKCEYTSAGTPIVNSADVVMFELCLKGGGP